MHMLEAPTSKGINRNTSLKIALIAIFGTLVFVSSLLNRYTLQGTQIVFAIVYGAGILLLAYPGAATIIALIAGSIYMFQSSLGFLSITLFAVRGIFTDILFMISGIYKDARKGVYNWIKISTALAIASFLTGFFQYLFFVLFLKVLIDFGAFIVSAIFITAIASNGIGGFILAKYIMPRLPRLGSDF